MLFGQTPQEEQYLSGGDFDAQTSGEGKQVWRQGLRRGCCGPGLLVEEELLLLVSTGPQDSEDDGPGPHSPGDSPVRQWVPEAEEPLPVSLGHRSSTPTPDTV